MGIRMEITAASLSVKSVFAHMRLHANAYIHILPHLLWHMLAGARSQKYQQYRGVAMTIDITKLKFLEPTTKKKCWKCLESNFLLKFKFQTIERRNEKIIVWAFWFADFFGQIEKCTVVAHLIIWDWSFYATHIYHLRITNGNHDD